MTAEERLKILEQLYQGQITADEAEQLLAGQGVSPRTAPDDNAAIILPTEDIGAQSGPQRPPDVAHIWKYITLAGGVLLAGFGLLLLSITSLLTVLCFGPLVLLGLAVVATGLWSRSGHWIHIEINEKAGESFRFSLPFPLSLAGWMLRLLNPFIKLRTGQADLSGLDIATLLQAMGDDLSPDNPLMVAIDDEDDQVLVYIT